ncbi:DUF1648 domain-containing protein [Haloarcula salinisoli]|uniref:DUF1648 domain-containing protein n=1 Tax=Haloarcula salinisoli TaxID=2487746 RepID=A0A8J7YEA7_9EURY|nr:DUF1648 domain-containing protein [Halomicroarcula salinisoli]MBX0287195.1 DUF1648 domain-containing protein [Halomicroarcula salinisoli]MBX0304500.1 DUF1648 domain-containing protein [Halomicroarcula salinisoli]
MPPSWARSDGLAAGIVALAALAGIALWPQLPAEVAIHVSASGTPDTYVPKAVGVLLVPAIMIATLLVLRVALYVDPPSNPRTGPVAVLATMGFLAAVHLLVLVWNAGYPVPLDGLLVGSIVFGALLCGYAIWRERLSPR